MGTKEIGGVLAWLGRRWNGGRAARDAVLPLYTAVVARARAEHWFRAGAVPDTVDGRFDMIAAVLAMVLLRLEAEAAGAEPAARLAECFVADMDGQLREIGIGDVVVGKHIGKMMSMLGGRLGAYRDALAPEIGGGNLAPALTRNLYRGAAPTGAAVAHVADALTALHRDLTAMPLARIVAGTLP